MTNLMDSQEKVVHFAWKEGHLDSPILNIKVPGQKHSMIVLTYEYYMLLTIAFGTPGNLASGEERSMGVWDEMGINKILRMRYREILQLSCYKHWTKKSDLD